MDRSAAPHTGAAEALMWSRRQESNLRPCAPKAPALPAALHRDGYEMGGRHGRNRTDVLCVSNAAEYLSFPHADVKIGGCKWIRTIGLRLIKTMLYLLSYAATRNRWRHGSPRRDRTAALLVNSQALYRLSYRGNELGWPAAHLHRARWRRRSDSNRRGLAPTVLQTAAFDRLATSPRNKNGGDARDRTANLRFWRPTLCQLSYTPGIRRSAPTCGCILLTTPLLAPRARFALPGAAWQDVAKQRAEGRGRSPSNVRPPVS